MPNQNLFLSSYLITKFYCWLVFDKCEICVMSKTSLHEIVYTNKQTPTFNDSMMRCLHVTLIILSRRVVRENLPSTSRMRMGELGHLERGRQPNNLGPLHYT